MMNQETYPELRAALRDLPDTRVVQMDGRQDRGDHNDREDQHGAFSRVCGRFVTPRAAN